MTDTTASETAPGCVFCGIVDERLPADVVAATSRVLAFRDLHPQAPVHVLVVPRRHIADASVLGEHDAQDVVDLFLTARRVAEQEGILERGYRLVVNVGDDACNSVPHLHLHLLGGRRLSGQGG